MLFRNEQRCVQRSRYRERNDQERSAAESAGVAMTAAARLIPGAYEQNTRTRRQPGSMGGGLFGIDGVVTSTTTMSAETIADRQREGGGGPGQRRGDRVTESR